MSSRAPTSRQIAPVTSLALKVAGVVVTLAALLDMFILPIPYQPLNQQWQLNFITQIVDRGIVPLVGLALILTGFWVDSLIGTAVKRKLWLDLKFWTVLLASLLGLFYLMAIPLHLNNVRLARQEAVTRIDQEASQTESQLEGRLSQEVGQQRQQIDVLLQNEELLDQALQSGQVTQEQAAQLQQYRDNPDALNQFVEQRTEELRTQIQTQIGVRRQDLLASTRTEAIKSGVRIGLGSLLLAIGYLIIGWTGLRNLD
ncbi:MAG: hypothetical protein HC881_22855 [Leptolyngbyaceae cyanobacterium SL_7_1]|nr:hypothetical protein [Leptolyngbyaceae cyanobacterium SL_7_1]